jgi:hypothetical protein
MTLPIVDAVAQGDRASLFTGAGEVAGSSPASVTISMKKSSPRVVEKNADLEKLAKKLDVLEPWEALGG